MTNTTSTHNDVSTLQTFIDGGYDFLMITDPSLPSDISGEIISAFEMKQLLNAAEDLSDYSDDKVDEAILAGAQSAEYDQAMKCALAISADADLKFGALLLAQPINSD